MPNGKAGPAACGSWATSCGAISRSAIRPSRAWPPARGSSLRAIRQADPRARLIATGQDPDHFESWNAAQLANAPGAFNYLSTHFVVGSNQVTAPNPTREFMAAASLALPVGLERRLRLMKQQIDADERTRGKVRIAFTEWLFAGPEKQVPMYNNLGGALCTAGFLNTLMRVADFTPVADMTGLIEFGGVWQNRGRHLRGAGVLGVPHVLDRRRHPPGGFHRQSGDL